MVSCVHLPGCACLSPAGACLAYFQAKSSQIWPQMHTVMGAVLGALYTTTQLAPRFLGVQMSCNLVCLW